MRAGDPALAERICRQALNAFPRDANLLCLLGATLIRQDKAQQAEHTLSRAAQLYPTFSRAQEGLAEALILQGKLPEALEALERAEKLEPASASVKIKKGRVLDALGRNDEADTLYEESIRLTPNREDLVRGIRLQRMGNLREAERIYQAVLAKDPEDVDALRLLAGIAMQAKQHGDAEVLLARAVEIAPDFYQGWMDLGNAQREQDRLDEALESYRRAMRLKPELPQPYTGAGMALGMAGRHAEAIEMFEAGLAQGPAHAGALAGLGHVQKTVGDQAAAIDAYRRCVEHNPWHGEAWWSLANLKTYRFSAEDVATMEAEVAAERTNDEQRAHFQFALGKAYEDAGDHARAFEYYRQGNENRREREKYDPVQTIDMHDQCIEVFTREFFEQNAGRGDPRPDPIFIVGLPRSGSTLIEQILASHPDVEGTHELPDMSRVARSIGTGRQDRLSYPRAVRELGADDLARLGATYLDKTRRHRETDAPRFTDKLPNNFTHAGLISAILPNATIIDARRHPLDSCLGSYKQLFARGQPFTYDLFELGEFYLEYRRLMAHWHEVLPGSILEVQYETVVEDLEGQVRRILEHCGLAWHDDCLRFYETDRAVKTASSEQVRQPIYKGALHRWRHYETELEPLIEILAPVLRDLPADWQPASLRSA